MAISLELVRTLESALQSHAPDFDTALQLVEIGREPQAAPGALIAAALRLDGVPLHMQTIEPTQVLRHLHDSFASEPAYLIGARRPGSGHEVKDLARELVRQVSRSMRSAVAVDEFWLNETKALYDGRRCTWEFAYLITHLESAEVLVGHSQARPHTGPSRREP